MDNPVVVAIVGIQIWRWTWQVEREIEDNFVTGLFNYAKLVRMWLKFPSLKTSLRRTCKWTGTMWSRNWVKPARIVAGVFIGLVFAGSLLLPRVSLAGELPREPVRLSTWLDFEDCAATPEVLRLSPDVALGLVAFNTPYLFGGKALRSQLTCGACHAKEGPSGAAVRIRLRAPVPDIRAATGRIDVAAFVDHAVVSEFAGPPLPRRTALALAALAGVLAPITSTPTQTCRIDAPSLVAIGLRLAIAQVGTADAGAGNDELDFLLDSLRFILGEMARSTPPNNPNLLLADTNRALHDAAPAVDEASRNIALVTLQRVSERWEKTFDRPHLVLAFGAAKTNE